MKRQFAIMSFYELKRILLRLLGCFSCGTFVVVAEVPNYFVEFGIANKGQN